MDERATPFLNLNVFGIHTVRKFTFISSIIDVNHVRHLSRFLYAIQFAPFYLQVVSEFIAIEEVDEK